MKVKKILRPVLPILIILIVSSIIIILTFLANYERFHELNLPDIMPNQYVLSILGGMIIALNCCVFIRVGLLKGKKLFSLMVIINVLTVLYVFTILYIDILSLSLLIIFIIAILDLFVMTDESLNNYSWIYFIGYVLKVYGLVLNYAIVMLN